MVNHRAVKVLHMYVLNFCESRKRELELSCPVHLNYVRIKFSSHIFRFFFFLRGYKMTLI